MIVQYASDLHLEFPQNKEFLKDNPLLPEGDVLLLAGDIVPFATMDKHDDFFNYISDHFQTTYWLPGNHEYYYADLADRSGYLQEKIRSNVFLVNNYQAIHEDVRFIFSTLWTRLSVANQWKIQQGLSDFHVIKYNDERLTPDVYNEQHTASLEFIKQQLEQPVDKTVVVTHHMPTFLNYPEKYKGDILNEAFAVELFDLIETSGVNYWLYGHHHQNTPDFAIGKTQLLANQLGYVKYEEHQLFDTSKAFEI